MPVNGTCFAQCKSGGTIAATGGNVKKGAQGPGRRKPNRWLPVPTGPIRRKLRSSGRKISWTLRRIRVRLFDYILRAGQTAHAKTLIGDSHATIFDC